MCVCGGVTVACRFWVVCRSLAGYDPYTRAYQWNPSGQGASGQVLLEKLFALQHAADVAKPLIGRFQPCGHAWCMRPQLQARECPSLTLKDISECIALLAGSCDASVLKPE